MTMPARKKPQLPAYGVVKPRAVPISSPEKLTQMFKFTPLASQASYLIARARIDPVFRTRLWKVSHRMVAAKAAYDSFHREKVRAARSGSAHEKVMRNYEHALADTFRLLELMQKKPPNRI